MIIVIILLLITCILIACCYLLKADSLSNKLLTSCYLTNVFILLICFWGVISGNSSYIDVALIYAVLSPAGAIIIIRYLRER